MLATTVLLAGTVTAIAGVNTLTATGPDGGLTFDVEFVSGGALLAATSGGVYRATDANADWVRTGPSTLRWGTQQVAVNPANRSQILLAANNVLFRSIDGGVSWTAIPNLDALQTNFISTIRFSQDGSLAWMTQQNGGTVFRSLDAGLTWTTASTGFTYSFFEIEPDPANAQLLYARSADGVFVSKDGGLTFTRMIIGGQYVSALAASRTSAEGALAVNSDDAKVYRSTDGGVSWIPTTYVPPFVPDKMKFLESVPGTAGKLYAMSEFEHLLRTLDDGESWTDLGPTPNGQILSMNFDPANSARILLATYGGIFESTDDGASWKERNRGLREGPARGIAVSRAGSGATYMVTNDLASVYRRAGDGSWTPMAAAATPLLGSPASSMSNYGWYPIAVGRQDAQRVYIARNAQIGVSADGGASWTAHAMPLYPTTLAVASHNDGHLYAGSVSVIPVRSLDAGLNWEALSSHGLPAGVSHFAFDPTNANVIYAAVDNFYPPATTAVYKSVDGGTTFNPVPWDAAHNPSFVWGLVHDPVRTNVVYLHAYHGLFKTTDGGATWTRYPLYNDVQRSGGAIALEIDPQSPDILYASASFSPVLSRSADGGVSWEDFASETGDSSSRFNRIALLPGTRNRIVATRVNGAREIDLVSQLVLATSTPTAVANAAATSTFNIRNAGALTVTNLQLTATLPASSTAIAAQPSVGTCTIDAAALSCALGRLAGSAQVSVSVTYTPTAAGSWSATASVYEVEDSATDNTAQVTVNVAPPVGGGSGGAGGGASSGGGGGGRLDYLLLAGLVLLTIHRMPPLRRYFPRMASALRNC